MVVWSKKPVQGLALKRDIYCIISKDKGSKTMKNKNKNKESDEAIIQRFCRAKDAIDYKIIQDLKDKAGVSVEYLRECEKIHGKHVTSKKSKEQF